MAELISDLGTVSKGLPPFQAREKYDHRLLESLATRGERQQPQREDCHEMYLDAIGKHANEQNIFLI